MRNEETRKPESAAKSKVVIVDMDKSDRLASEILETVNEHLDREPMIGAEIILALNRICYTVVGAWDELQKEKALREKAAGAA